MMLRFTETATTHEREAVAAAAARREIAFTATAGGLVLDRATAAEDALLLASMPGVAAVEPDTGGHETVYEAGLVWVAGAATVLGLLTIVAANLPATVGVKADPLRTPGAPRPSWPLIAWYSAADRAPSWAQVHLVLIAALLALVFWPNLARPLAEKRPLLHALVGAAAIAAFAALFALEALR